MAENLPSCRTGSSADVMSILKDLSNNVFDACVAKHCGGDEVHSHVFLASSCRDCRWCEMDLQALTAEARRAKDAIFGAALQAFSLTPAGQEESTTLQELCKQMAARYPGIEADFTSLSGSDTEKHDQVRDSQQFLCYKLEKTCNVLAMSLFRADPRVGRCA